MLQESGGGEGRQRAADRMYLLPKTVPPLQPGETPEGGVPRQVLCPTLKQNTVFYRFGFVFKVRKSPQTKQMFRTIKTSHNKNKYIFVINLEKEEELVVC